MASVAVQAGHCFRRTGAVGAPGEQSFTDRVSRRAVQLLRALGHDAVRVLADGVAYRAWDAFVAVHYDGNDNPAVRGASVGYPAHAGSRALAAAWKSAYGRAWPHSFRADNYTSALANYYGNRLALAAGARAAIICEFGFGTNPTERAWMEANVEACAGSIVDAVGARFGHPRPPALEGATDPVEGGTVAAKNNPPALIRIGSRPEVFETKGGVLNHIRSRAELLVKYGPKGFGRVSPQGSFTLFRYSEQDLTLAVVRRGTNERGWVFVIRDRQTAEALAGPDWRRQRAVLDRLPA